MELRDAVEKEEYERAAVLRDRIRTIGECHEDRG
jgi:protein-arginine kinase activator protein McsA